MIFDSDATEAPETGEMVHVPLTPWCCDTLHDLLACGDWLHMPIDGHVNGGVIHGGTNSAGNEIWIQFCPGCGEKIGYVKRPNDRHKVAQAQCHACANIWVAVYPVDACEQDLECPACHAASGEVLPCPE